MAKHTGTAKGIAVWFRQQRASADTFIELHAVPLEGAQLVASWPVSDILDVDAWSSIVDELATSDANARDASTRYELRHVVDEKPRGISHLRRVVERGEEPMQTGDVASVIAQLQRTTERAHAQVIESARVATSTANAAIESQRAALLMLAQSYQLIGQLQTANQALHSRVTEIHPVETLPTEPSPGDVAFKQMVELFTPVAAQALLGFIEAKAGTSDDAPEPSSDAT